MAKKEHWSKRVTWHEFEGGKCPVKETAKVAYRMMYADGSGTYISHIHVPVMAKEINWDSTRSFGRIYKYAVVG